MDEHEHETTGASDKTPKIKEGAGDDGVTAAGDGDAGSVGLGPDAGIAVPDGVDGQDVEQVTPESAPPPPPPPPPSRVGQRVAPTPGVHFVRVDVDADGNGSAMLGIDHDNIQRATSINPTARITWGPAHTLSITKIEVAKATETDGTVLVTVEAK